MTTEKLPAYVTGTASEDEIKRAIGDYELAMTPAPLAEIVKLLSVLRVTTASRNADGQDSELLLEAYSRGLASYPADVVAHVLKRLRKWFPTLSELVEECRAEVAHREQVLSSLRSKLFMVEMPQPAVISSKPSVGDDERLRLFEKFKPMRDAINRKTEAVTDKGKSQAELLAELEALKGKPVEISDALKNLVGQQIEDDAMMREIRKNVAAANGIG